MIELTIIGKGPDVEKMQKRLNCAARAINVGLCLHWKHEYPQLLNIPAIHSVVVTNGKEIVLDGIKSTEDIESILIDLN